MNDGIFGGYCCFYMEVRDVVVLVVGLWSGESCEDVRCLFCSLC